MRRKCARAWRLSFPHRDDSSYFRFVLALTTDAKFPRLWRVTMRGRLLLVSALFAFVQIPVQAQMSLDISKLTCEQLVMEALPWPSRDFVMWLSGYFNGKRDNTTSSPRRSRRTWVRFSFIATKTGKPPLLMPSRTRSVLTNDRMGAALWLIGSLRGCWMLEPASRAYSSARIDPSSTSCRR